MNRILILFLLLPFYALAQKSPAIPVYTRDSFKVRSIFYLEGGWRFHVGDSSSMAAVDFDDSRWSIVNSNLIKRKIADSFNSIAWFRYHLITDSSLSNFPLSLAMNQLGASEIYFDGEKIESFGKINGKDSSEYCDPQGLPFLLPVIKAGHHVIAVRYANYQADRNSRVFHNSFRGIEVALGETRFFIASDRNQTLLTSIIYLLLFGIFISLAMSHLFLFLYYRSLKSNLFFCIFCFAMGIGFMEVFLDRTCTNPIVELANNYITLVVVSSSCYALSGFTHELFSDKKRRFRIVTVCALLAPFVWIIHARAGIIIYLSLVGMVLGQTIFLTVRAIYRRVKGAWIIGAGLLFFAIFFYSILIRSIGGLNINEHTTSGAILLFTAACAILAIPVSLSLYLAWSFAGINKDLGAQLQQVLKNKSINDNINYARRIQSAMLPDVDLIYKHLRQSFILFLPKDIVSGDFYTFSAKDDRVLIVSGDCTGHGVSGALMSMVGISLINQIINEKGIREPAVILNHLNALVIDTFRRGRNESNDGMDICICSYDLNTGELQFAGANRPLWLVRNGHVEVVRPDKFPIGGLQLAHDRVFTNNVLQLQASDTFYMFTDGYADQFGGEKGKKLMTGKFKELLLSIQDRQMSEQETFLKDYFETWKGSNEQVDDVLVIGVRV